MVIKKADFEAVSAKLDTANIKIADLEKKLVSETQMKDYHYKNYQEVSAELEQVNQLLDAMPNSVSRESEGENSWNRVKRSPVTRLAAWLAIR